MPLCWKKTAPPSGSSPVHPPAWDALLRRSSSARARSSSRLPASQAPWPTLTQQYPAERILVLPLDVTQPHQVADAFAKAKERSGRMDIVVNNAGIADIGKLEGMEDSKARGLLETNFWGAVSVTKEALKCFRETNPRGIGGRLLKISSYLGLVGLPALPFYCAAKFALEGATEALAAELDSDWNIKISNPH